MATLSKEAKAARNAYRREYYKANKEKCLKWVKDYWERKAEETQGVQDEKAGNV